MRIALINSIFRRYQVGGAEVSVEKLATSLRGLGIDVDVISLHSEGVLEQVEVDGGRDIFVPIENRYWPFKAERRGVVDKILWHSKEMWNIHVLRHLESIITPNSYSIVHTNSIHGFGALPWHVANRCGIPVVHTLRDYGLACLYGKMFTDRRCLSQCAACWVSSIRKRQLSHSVTALIGISHWIKGRYLGLGYFQKASIQKVIYNCGLGACAEERGAGYHGPVVMGYLGRLDPTKGVEIIIDGMRGSDKPVDELVIAGDGSPDYVSHLKRRAEGLAVRFVGRVNPKEFLRGVSLLAIPSVWDEPMGRVFVEALESGIPSIVSNRGGLPELVEYTGVGWVFSVDEPDGYRVKLREALGCWREHAYRAKVAAERFSVEKMTNEYLQVYEAARGARKGA